MRRAAISRDGATRPPELPVHHGAAGPASGGGPLTAFDAELQSRLAQVTHRMTYAQVSRITGFHRETCRRYLVNGSPTVEFLAALCGALEVSVHWLLLGIGPRKRDEQPGEWLRTIEPVELLMEVGRRWRDLKDVLGEMQARLARLETDLTATRGGMHS